MLVLVYLALEITATPFPETLYDIAVSGVTWGSTTPVTGGPCVRCLMNGHMFYWEQAVISTAPFSYTGPNYPTNPFLITSFNHNVRVQQRVAEKTGDPISITTFVLTPLGTSASSQAWFAAGAPTIGPMSISREPTALKSVGSTVSFPYAYTYNGPYALSNYYGTAQRIWSLGSDSVNVAAIKDVYPVDQYGLSISFDYDFGPYGVWTSALDVFTGRTKQVWAGEGGIKPVYYFRSIGPSTTLDVCAKIDQFYSEDAASPSGGANPNARCTPQQVATYTYNPLPPEKPNSGVLLCIPGVFNSQRSGYLMRVPSDSYVASSELNNIICSSTKGGLFCNQTIPTGFDVDTATSCPDPTVFDLCSGRGHCRLKPGGVGVYCMCARGWVGNHSFVPLYAIDMRCGDSATTWSDSVQDSIVRYASLHQCLYFIGPRYPYNWNITVPVGDVPDSIVSPSPVPDYRCADNRLPNYIAPASASFQYTGGKFSVNSFYTRPLDVDTTTLYGGLHCSACPPCDPLHSYGCFASVTNRNASDPKRCT